MSSCLPTSTHTNPPPAQKKEKNPNKYIENRYIAKSVNSFSYFLLGFDNRLLANSNVYVLSVSLSFTFPKNSKIHTHKKKKKKRSSQVQRRSYGRHHTTLFLLQQCVWHPPKNPIQSHRLCNIDWLDG